MSTLPISSIAALSPQIASPSSSSTPASSNLATQSTFLQLLVAQLKNQDPEQPTDGTAFVTELAQFTTLQEDTESATDLDTIVASLPGLTPTPPTTPAAPSSVSNINQ